MTCRVKNKKISICHLMNMTREWSGDADVPVGLDLSSSDMTVGFSTARLYIDLIVLLPQYTFTGQSRIYQA